MPVSLQSFKQAAHSAWFGSSDILVGKSGQNSAVVGNLLFSSGRKANEAAMTAFREALSKEFGVFGEHAFDTILGLRMQTHKSLRACDIKKVLSNIEFLKANRYISEYSDGHPKLMLEAKFAEDYKDMGKGYLKDGRIVPPNGQKLESLGKYKATFLVLADRDAVGSKGQNKGFSQGSFFAIDPGHSLEGNGKDLQIEDNLSFKDTHGFALTSRFANYSVFDDDTRFAKFQGILRLRDLKNSGKIENLFRDYRMAFDPDAPNIDPPEKELRKKIIDEIDKKEEEFRENLDKVFEAGKLQLALYDSLQHESPEIQEKAIETIENLEKLTSPTTWMSKNGKVPLKHLEVIPETRNPWYGEKVGSNIVYRSRNAVSKQARANLEEYAKKSGAVLSFGISGEARLIFHISKAAQEMDVFAESNVARTTHPEEAAARA